jgi:hypothetical protein
MNNKFLVFKPFYLPLQFDNKPANFRFLLSNYYNYKRISTQSKNRKQLLNQKLIILKGLPYTRGWLTKNDKVITSEFYNFWFKDLRSGWWVNNSFFNQRVNIDIAKWQLFRSALHSRKARNWRNSVSFNWTKALQSKGRAENNLKFLRSLSTYLEALNRSIKKHIYILNTPNLTSKFNLTSRIQVRLSHLKKRKEIIKKLISKLVLSSSCLNQKRVNLYYNLYTRFDTSLRPITSLLAEKMRLNRFFSWTDKRRIASKLYWPILHNKFPNFSTTAKFRWFNKQLRKFSNRYFRNNVVYKLVSEHKTKEILKPTWINWKLTNKFRNLRRWGKKKIIVKTRNSINQLLVFTNRKHLRLKSSKRRFYSLIINLTSRNFFINVVRSKSGSPIKIFSGGTMKVKTKRLRKAFATFTKAFLIAIKFFKFRSIYKLNFIKIIQDSINPGIKINVKNIRFLNKLLKDNSIKRVKRWILTTKYIHGLPPRGPKLRRK